MLPSIIHKKQISKIEARLKVEKDMNIFLSELFLNSNLSLEVSSLEEESRKHTASR